jgi:hypothetical protein
VQGLIAAIRRALSLCRLREFVGPATLDDVLLLPFFVR